MPHDTFFKISHFEAIKLLITCGMMAVTGDEFEKSGVEERTSCNKGTLSPWNLERDCSKSSLEGFLFVVVQWTVKPIV
jgi:hypothetical protein